MYALPPVTQALIVTNVVVFFAAGMFGGSFTYLLALWPPGANFIPWQVLSYAFVHGSLSHLLFNMFGVYMFGGDLERVWGGRRFLKFYLVCAFAAAVVQLVVAHLGGAQYPTVGASGAVFGLLVAFAMVFPNRVVTPLFPPIPMRAPVFVAVYGVLELVLGVSGTQQGVAHFAHLGGLAGGYLYMRLAGRRR